MARDLEVVYGSAPILSVATGGVYTLEVGTTAPWIRIGVTLKITGCTNGANNGVFTVTAVAGLVITTSNAASVVEAASPGVMGYIVGGTAPFEVDSWHIVEKDHVAARLEFTFLIAHQTEATFATLCAAAEDIFRQPREDCVVTLGTSPILTLKHSDNTGFDAYPRVVKRADVGDTGRSRRYTIRIEFGLPSNNVSTNDGKEGQRTVEVDVAYSPARRRTLTITGTYTAVPGGTTARAQYEAKIDAFATSVKTALGGTWELADEPKTTHNATNKTLDFSRVYDELIFSQGGASLDDAAIVRQSLIIRRSKVGPGDTPTANRLIEMTATYSAFIDKTVSTDLKGKYNSIRAWIVSQMQTISGGSGIALVEDSPSFDFDNNVISASLRAMVAASGGVIENRIETEDYDLFGVVLIPAWTGRPFSKYRFDGPQQRKRTITSTYRVLGFHTAGTASGGGGGGGGGTEPALINLGFGGAPGGFGGGITFSIGGFNFPAFGGGAQGLFNQIQALNNQENGAGGGSGGAPGGGGLVEARMARRVSSTPIRLGIDGYTLDVTDFVVVIESEFYEPLGPPGTNTPTPTGTPVSSVDARGPQGR